MSIFTVSGTPDGYDISGWAERASVGLGSVGGVDIEINVDAADLEISPEAAIVGAPARGELYRIDRGERIRVTVATAAAVPGALNAVRRGLRYGLWEDGVTQWPRFEVRGMIEGFYGPPWSHAERLDMVAFLADHDFNLFILAPKDDAAQRRDWRTPLSPGAVDELQQIVDAGVRSGVEIASCISPGLSIRYSDATDLGLLVDRARQLIDVGIRRIGLLLDDIPVDLQYDEDRATYPSIAHAHGSLGSRLAAALWQIDPSIRVMVCPLEYHGLGTEEYLRVLGQTLSPRIDIFWTGREICSRRIELLEAATFTRTALRPPLYWDNYPVNDVAMVGELHVGPITGRDPHLYRLSTGFVANAMDRAEASKVPLATLGDYLRDPVGYEPWSSWERAWHDVAGDGDAEAYLAFAETVLVSCLGVTEPAELAQAAAEAGFRIVSGDRDGAARLFDEQAAVIDRVAEHLSGEVANLALAEQCRPWVQRYGQGAAALRTIASFLRGAGDLDAVESFRHPRSPRVFADVVSMFIDDLHNLD